MAYCAKEGANGRWDVSREEGCADGGVGCLGGEREGMRYEGIWYNKAYGFVYGSNIFPFPHYYSANDIPSLVQ